MTAVATEQPWRIAERASVAPGRVELRIQRVLRTPNDYLGRHWREKSRERKAWQMHIANAVVAAVGVAGAQALLGPEAELVGCHGTCRERRRVEVTRLAPARRRFIRDDDNLRFAVKPVLDALKHLALIRDDRREWLDLPTPAQGVSDDRTFWTVIVVSETVAAAASVRTRCALPQAHAGPHLWIDSTADALLGECQAAPASRVPCGAHADGLHCDREIGHAGDHRGYREEQDVPVFWRGKRTRAGVTA